MKNGLRELGIICLLALVPALLAAWLHPVRPSPPDGDGVLSISCAEAAALSRQLSVLWIDARPEAAFADDHIPGAQRLALQEWETLLPGVMEAWDPTRPIIVYCDAAACDVSRQVALRLRVELQSNPIYVLEGGWVAWNQAHAK